MIGDGDSEQSSGNCSRKKWEQRLEDIEDDEARHFFEQGRREQRELSKKRKSLTSADLAVEAKQVTYALSFDRMERSLREMNEAVEKYSYGYIKDLALKNLARLAVLEFRAARLARAAALAPAVPGKPPQLQQQLMELEASSEQPGRPSIEAQATVKTVLKAKHLFQAFVRSSKRGTAALCAAIAESRDAGQLLTVLEWVAPLLLEGGLASFELCTYVYALLVCLHLPLLDDTQDLLYKLLLALRPLDQAAHVHVLCLVIVNGLLAPVCSA